MLSPRSRTGWRLAALTPFVLVVLALGACGGGSSSSTENGGSSPAKRTVQASGRQVTATETEYHIQLSPTSLRPGTYI